MPPNLALERLSQEDACEFRASLKHDFISKRMRETYRGWKMKRRRGERGERRGVKGNIINSKVSFFFLFFFSELGTEPRALHLLGKRSTTEPNPRPQF